MSIEAGSRTARAEILENLRLELRRGCVIVAVLAQLRREHYGYALRKALAEQGMAIEENTLYPLLRRLESQGLLESHWREEDRRNKRFYRLSADGDALLKELLAEWQDINESLSRITSGCAPAGGQEGSHGHPRHVSEERRPLPAGRR